MSSIGLLDQNKKGKWVWHDEFRDPHRLMRDIREYLQIDTIATTDDECDVYAGIFRILEHFREFARLRPFSSFIEEDDLSFHLFEYFYDEECLFYSDIFWIGMWDRFYTFDSGEFLYTLFVFSYCFREMLEAVSDSKYGYHEMHDTEKSKLSKNFLTRAAFFIQSARVPL